MSKALTNPLAGIVAAATKTLPAKTGQTERIRRRLEASSDVTVILADVSSSMADQAGGARKIDILRDALNALPNDCRLVSFASMPRDVASAADLPVPAGGTALDRALDHAAKYRPRRTIVISDGEPDNEADAEAAAQRLSGTIDVIYCGPDSNRRAIDFLRRLARGTGGSVIVHDLNRTGARVSATTIGAAIRHLALPAR